MVCKLPNGCSGWVNLNGGENPLKWRLIKEKMLMVRVWSKSNGLRFGGRL